MAESNTAESAPNSPDSAPTLVAVGDEPSEPRAAVPQESEPERKGVSKTLFWVVVALLVLSITGLGLQTQHAAEQATRITALSGQVEGLQSQLSAANTQIATYGMQRDLVRKSVSDLLEQTLLLSGLVDVDPLAPAGTFAPSQP